MNPTKEQIAEAIDVFKRTDAHGAVLAAYCLELVDALRTARKLMDGKPLEKYTSASTAWDIEHEARGAIDAVLAKAPAQGGTSDGK